MGELGVRKTITVLGVMYFDVFEKADDFQR